jgi:glycosyltransferase involved in cell wall biosynthesis
VAVVVPCHDDGATLRDALGSLAHEEPHELVVVDDGSNDLETLELLDELRRDGVRVVRQANAGLSAARMAGVEATAARYVFPLDADDMLAPGSLADLAAALDGGDAVVAWGDVELWGAFDYHLRTGATLDPWQITYLNTLPVASLVRRDALLAVGGWQLRHGYEDWDLWMSFAERGWRGIHIARPVLRYRRRPGRMLSGTMARHAEIHAHMRERHPRLFAGRRRNWLRSRAPLRARLLYPLVAVAPLRGLRKLALFQLLDDPRQFAAVRRLRRRADLRAIAP